MNLLSIQDYNVKIRTDTDRPRCPCSGYTTECNEQDALAQAYLFMIHYILATRYNYN